jgi:hypothetical protein
MIRLDYEYTLINVMKRKLSLSVFLVPEIITKKGYTYCSVKEEGIPK